MKNISFLFFTLMYFSLSAQTIDPDLEEKDLIMYYKGEDKPYTGPCIGYYENGIKGKEGQYIDGRMQGKWSWWYDTGEKKREGNYNKGEKNDLWVDWYKNGNKRSAVNYKNGIMDGESGWWYENGNKKKITIYKEGVFMVKKEWDINGNEISDSFK
ncbi:MAG: hypothetical protein HY738_02160 [Bacteroidia bacterium]|nr:hypothetical protein [Bacteroidia bacterium]